MSTPNDVDGHHTHSDSAQRHLAENHASHDPKTQKEEVIFSEGTTSEESTGPSQLPHDQEARRRYADTINKVADISDTEKGSLSPDRLGEEDPRTHSSTFYARYRVYIHLVIWLFFTGLVFISLTCLTSKRALVWKKT